MTFSCTFLHTNLTVLDIEKITKFYVNVFGCVPVRDEQLLSGKWIEEITAVADAEIRYVHLRLPGYGVNGPELELIQYNNPVKQYKISADSTGFGHIAFSVDNVKNVLQTVIAAGGASIGELVTVDIPGRGRLTEVYATDPEGNIIELQSYEK